MGVGWNARGWDRSNGSGSIGSSAVSVGQSETGAGGTRRMSLLKRNPAGGGDARNGTGKTG